MKIKYLIKIGNLYRTVKKITFFNSILYSIYLMVFFFLSNFLLGSLLMWLEELTHNEKGLFLDITGENFLFGMIDVALNVEYEFLFITLISVLLISKKIIMCLIEKTLFSNKVMNLHDVLNNEIPISKDIKNKKSVFLINSEYAEYIVKRINSVKTLNSRKDGLSMVEVNYSKLFGDLWVMSNSHSVSINDIILYGDYLEEDIKTLKSCINQVDLINENSVSDDEYQVINKPKDFSEVNKDFFVNKNPETISDTNQSIFIELYKKIKTYRILYWIMLCSFISCLVTYIYGVYTNYYKAYDLVLVLFIFSIIYYVIYQMFMAKMIATQIGEGDGKNHINYFQNFFKKFNKNHLNENEINYLALYQSLALFNIVDETVELSEKQKIIIAQYYFNNFDLKLLKENDGLIPEIFIVNSLFKSKMRRLLPTVL